MNKAKKDTLLVNTMASVIMLLDNYYELEDTKLYSKEVKRYGNMFYGALRNKMSPFENALHQTGEIQEAGDYAAVIESIIGDVSKFNMKELRMVVMMFDQLKQGKVLDVSPEVYKKLQNS